MEMWRYSSKNVRLRYWMKFSAMFTVCPYALQESLLLRTEHVGPRVGLQLWRIEESLGIEAMFLRHPAVDGCYTD
jgi:hypothetical protein